MRDPILIDRIACGSFLSRPSAARSKLDALRANDSIFRQAGEFEISAEGMGAASASPGRRRLWDFDTHLHCSIIGTCLSTAELRQIFVKLGRKEATTASEHDLHASGVLIAGQRRVGAKLLHKVLDRRIGSRLINSIKRRPPRRCAPHGRRRCNAARSLAPIGRH